MLKAMLIYGIGPSLKVNAVRAKKRFRISQHFLPGTLVELTDILQSSPHPVPSPFQEVKVLTNWLIVEVTLGGLLTVPNRLGW